MGSLSDEELAAQYRAEAGPARHRYLNELFERHYSRVGAWCYRLTGDRERAADLAQEIFVNAFRSIGSFRGESKFTTWLYTITRNHCLSDWQRRAARPEQMPDNGLAETADPRGGDPLQKLLESEAAETLRELMRTSLDVLETRVVTLHYGEEMPLDAITRLLGLTNPSGAKACLVSARRKLAAAAERWKARAARGRPPNE